MKSSYLKFILLLILAPSMINCSTDDELHQEIQLRLVSEVTGEPVTGVEVLVLAQGARGTGMFASIYEVSREIAQTDSNGYANVVLNYESSENFFTIYAIDEDISTDIIRHTNSFFFEEVQGKTPLELKVRRYFPMEIIVKSINPYDDNDQISVSFFHVGSSFISAPLYKIENRGDSNEPYGSPSFGDLQPFWIGDNVDSTIFKRVQEGTEAKISWTVTRNNMVTEFESEFIPTVQNGVTYYVINY